MAVEPHSGRDIATYPSGERRVLLARFVDEVVLPQRRRLLAYRAITSQSAQVADGYVGQVIASIVVGVPGVMRRGKTGEQAGDLSDRSEVKSSYRVDQMNGKEDAHINFGGLSAVRLAKFLSQKRCLVVHTSLDQNGRFKVDVLALDFGLREVALATVGSTVAMVRAWHEGRYASGIKAPQLQARLYPDNDRSRLATGATSMQTLGAAVLARAVETANGVVVDIWTPDEPSPLPQLLSLARPEDRRLLIHSIQGDPTPARFFRDCVVDFRAAIAPFLQLTRSSWNVGFGQLAQHLVSLATGTHGTGSNARGFDLEDGSEVKLATGTSGDSFGTESQPRLNLQGNQEKILAWPALYAVRIAEREGGRLAAKVLTPDIGDFRDRVRDYFAPGSVNEHSTNMQLHAPRDFETNAFTVQDSRGRRTSLAMEVVCCVEEQIDGSVVDCTPSAR
ncbi:MAG: MamI family restriction endonuclease [Candidatus Limnocylindrales bacterium]